MGAERVGLCVVGCGRIARSHLKGIAGLSGSVRLVAVADTVEERARSYAKEYGSEKWYSSLDQALADDEIDGLVLCLPHSVHAETAIACLNAGKHVLVEKPMATKAKDAQRMVEAAEANAMRLMVGQVLRFRDAERTRKQLVSSADIGRPVRYVQHQISARPAGDPATPWWTDAAKCGGFWLPLWGSHQFDKIFWYLEAEPVAVCAELQSNHPTYPGESDGTVLVRCDGGAQVALTFSCSTNLGDGYLSEVLTGTEGTVDVTRLTINGEPCEVDYESPGREPFELQIQEFADAIREFREPVASGREVKKVIDVIEGAQISSAEGRWVDLPIGS